MGARRIRQFLRQGGRPVEALHRLPLPAERRERGGPRRTGLGLREPFTGPLRPPDLGARHLGGLRGPPARQQRPGRQMGRAGLPVAREEPQRLLRPALPHRQLGPRRPHLVLGLMVTLGHRRPLGRVEQLAPAWFVLPHAYAGERHQRVRSAPRGVRLRVPHRRLGELPGFRHLLHEEMELRQVGPLEDRRRRIPRALRERESPAARRDGLPQPPRPPRRLAQHREHRGQQLRIAVRLRVRKGPVRHRARLPEAAREPQRGRPRGQRPGEQPAPLRARHRLCRVLRRPRGDHALLVPARDEAQHRAGQMVGARHGGRGPGAGRAGVEQPETVLRAAGLRHQLREPRRRQDPAVRVPAPAQLLQRLGEQPGRLVEAAQAAQHGAPVDPCPRGLGRQCVELLPVSSA